MPDDNQAKSADDAPADSLADDLLTGAGPIAAFLGWEPRDVYYRQAHLPIDRCGKLLISTKSRLRRHFSGVSEKEPA